MQRVETDRRVSFRYIFSCMSLSRVSSSSPNRNIWIVLACVNASTPLFETWEYRSGGINSTAALLSVVFVLAALNSMVLWSLFARAKRNGWPIQWKKLIIAASTMAVIAVFSTFVGVSLVKKRNNYYDLAMSNKPLSSIEPERKRLVVEYLRRAAANSQDENKAMAEAQKRPIDPAVYSTESFSSQEVMRSTLAQLTTYTQIDFDFSAKQQAVREDFRRKMKACDPGYLKSWDDDSTGYEQMQQSANQVEHDWFASVTALYSYGEQHARQIDVKGGKVSISDPDVGRKFDDLLNESKALHDKLESVVHDEVRRQQQSKAEIGG
jgi:hypothetical protein